MVESASSHPAATSNGVLYKTYKIARRYIQHEDTLASERLSRTLLVHGFLLASYGLLVQARMEGAAKYSAAADTTKKLAQEAQKHIQGILFITDVMLPVIALIGVLTALTAVLGIKAASRSIENIRNHWEEFAGPGKEKLGLPGLTDGTYNRKQHKDRSSILMLCSLLALWLIVTWLSIHSSYSRLVSGDQTGRDHASSVHISQSLGG